MKKLVLFLLIIGIIFSCSKKKKNDAEGTVVPTYPVELAKVISYVSNGNIGLDSDITVTFTDSVVDDAKVEVPIKKKVFECSPEIKGGTRFVDNRTIRLFPEKLEKETKYKCSLNIFNLLGDRKYKDLPVLDLNFETPGLEVVRFAGDFFPEDHDNPKNLYYLGTIEFNDTVDEKYVSRSLEITKDGDIKKFEGKISEDDSKVYNFQINGIKRGELAQEFFFKLTKSDELKISSDIEKTVTLPEMQKFVVNELKTDTRGEKPFFIISFSDSLSLNQDISGLITVDKVKTPLKFTKNGKDLVVKGDFSHGETYNVTVHKGIESKWGTKTTGYNPSVVIFNDINPQISFVSDGIFLPSSNRKKIRFKTVNLKKVKIEIKEVFENNLLFFLQDEKLKSGKKDYNSISHYSLERVGVKVLKKDLKIGEIKNTWQQHELDLSKVLKNRKGLYVVQLSFERKDMLFNFDENYDSYYGDDYYTNPNSNGYLYRNGRINKPVILSDIGITAKIGRKNQYVFVTNLVTADPMPGAVVKLKTYQNQLVAQSRTDSQGRAVFGTISDDVFFIEAELNGQRSIVKLNEMIWQASSFDTGGSPSSNEGVKAFIYSDRGVYRPGEKWNVGIIVRNESGSFPDNHPLSVKVYNPKDQKVFSTTLNKATDGFYVFSYKTAPLDPTGKWKVRFNVGSRDITEYIKVETVVPYKIKVDLKPEKTHLTSEDQFLGAEISSNFLVGSPASFFPATLTMKLAHKEKRFETYKKFRFSDETIDFKEIDETVFDGQLDKNGMQNVVVNVPDLENAPSEVKMTLIGKVLEKGGRPVISRRVVKIDPKDAYVGIKIPEMEWGYSEVSKPVKIKTVLVDSSGRSLAGRQLNVVIYHCSRYWWYEYGDYNRFKKNFRTNYATTVYKDFSVITKNTPVDFEFTPGEEGNYLIEIRDGAKGHVATGFLRASSWGGGTNERDASILTIKKDKERYNVGDTAFLTIPSPEKGRILFTLEKGSEVIEHKWITPSGGRTTIPVKIDRSMVPNVYAAVSIIQPHAQTVNDRPIRMYGITPILIDDSTTKQNVSIEVDDFLRPEKNFSVKVRTDKPGSQITIAVVDEGLLGLTEYKTPDPWKYFYSKERLSIHSYDLFDEVLGAHYGDVANRYSIGGDMALKYKKLQLAAKQAKRFKPVAMFKGPFKTDAKGEVKAEFTMPNYIGAVRIMAVSSKEDTYGSSFKEVKVKNELMVLPYLPRFIGVGDKFTFPVSVFAMNGQIKNVDVQVKVEGPVKIMEKGKKPVRFDKEGEQTVEFKAETLKEVGVAKITVTAVAGKYKAEKTIELDVRPPSSRIYETKRLTLDPGKSIKVKIPDKGLKGTNNAVLKIAGAPDINLGHRMKWLIRYPYGCIEQTVSSVFPQLYLKEFLKKFSPKNNKVDENINAGINRLVNFQTFSGGFSYWPGGKEANYWGTNYAGHFMIEARKRGYHVPGHLFDNWIKFERSQVVTSKHGMLMRTYMVYLLALAGKPELSAMNQLKEEHLGEMEDREKWLLAASYYLAGNKKVAKQIEKTAATTVRDYREFSYTYGSGLRDKAIIMLCAQTLNNQDVSLRLFEYLGEHLAKKSWYSTQTTGFILLALGKYIENRGDKDAVIKGTVKFPDGKVDAFEIKKDMYLKNLTDYGKDVEITIDSSSSVKTAFISMSWDGIPTEPIMCESDKLYLEQEYLDDDGYKTYPSKLKQGSSFWLHLSASTERDVYHKVDEVALQYMLPAGWEIENTRLSNDQLPEWMSRMNLAGEEYLDIRDDRVIWFFDLPQNGRDYDFVARINVVTKGEFILPSAILEAMYDHTYQACTVPTYVEVE